MVATISINETADISGICESAGQPEMSKRRYEDGVLHVDGITQAALDAALAAYDHDAVVSRRLQWELTAALNNHLNAVAGQRRYDDRFTCSLRAGYPGPFQQEGQVFAAWMDACNMAAYQFLAEVKQGLRPIPTEAELIAAMPIIEWPPSPIPDGAA